MLQRGAHLSRAVTVGVLLLLLLAPPAAAKGPTQVEVQDLRTGETTVLTHLDGGDMLALGELVGWPEERRAPDGVRRGTLEHVVTLTWQYDEQTPAWTDRVYVHQNGRTWVQRRDHLSGSEAVTWGRVEAGFALQAVLAGAGRTADDAGTTPTPATTQEAAAVAATRTPAPRSEAGIDVGSFGWGAAAAALVAGGLVLLGRRRRSASVG